MHTVLDNALVDCDITILRDKNSSISEFRSSLDRIALHLCSHVASSLPLVTYTVSTPLQDTTGHKLAGDIILVPILRAGLTLLHSFEVMIPNAKVGYIGLKRNEETLEPDQYYCNIPTLHNSSSVIILDPMLATGGSTCAAISELKKRGATSLSVACVIAAPEGISHVEHSHSDVSITCASLDEKLNDIGYIVPGLGDAGDRAHGTE